MKDHTFTMSFEEALTELESIVKRLEESKVPLEEAIAAYERGTKLRKYCEEKLTQAKLKVEKINLSNGEPHGTVPFTEEP